MLMNDVLPSRASGNGVRGNKTRIMSLWLPRLSTDRLVRTGKAQPDKAFAVFSRTANALRLSAVSEAAAALGVRRGQSLADARGAVPGLDVHEADPSADGAFLDAIADWGDRYTPLISLDVPDGLFLDISGCTHLFAKPGGIGSDGAGTEYGCGEARLVADLLLHLTRRGISARAAVAATPGAAWAVARFGQSRQTLIAAGGEQQALSALSVAALRLDDDQADLLEKLGLKRIGQLTGQPRAPLAARFGLSLIRRLDQALGFEDEPLSPRRPAPELSAERRFAEPLIDRTAVFSTVRSLADGLAGSLERLGVGVRHLELALFRVDGVVQRTAVSTSRPSRRAGDLAALFRERLDNIGEGVEPGPGFDTGTGLDMIRLSVMETERLEAVQVDLSGEADLAAGLDQLVDRIGARLGTGQVTRLAPVDSHIPERSFQRTPVVQTSVSAAMWIPAAAFDPGLPERPLTLFERPEPVEVMAEVPEGPPSKFRWRRVLYQIVRADGPERIAPEWWLDENSGSHSMLTRDYYRVEDHHGRRYWLYRDGLYEREASRPDWFLHGLFA